ncbi:MAG: hypothetical protein HOL85_01135 [Rhodospirillaceae bacterium]|nr:hypothetical protein [Rhodospirillaceae bacterium]MBT6136445.1 hypothetical protein [Rhodospirillaceae bacterium]
MRQRRKVTDRMTTGGMTTDDLARLWERYLKIKARRHRKLWRVEESMASRKRSGTVVQDVTRLKRIKDRAKGIRFAMRYEDLTFRQKKEMKQTLQNLELAIRGMERVMAGDDSEIDFDMEEAPDKGSGWFKLGRLWKK